jgi:hypothetical protein
VPFYKTCDKLQLLVDLAEAKKVTDQNSTRCDTEHTQREYMDRSVTQKILYGPKLFFLGTDRSIYCHMTLSAMNYLLYISILVQYSDLLCAIFTIIAYQNKNHTFNWLQKKILYGPKLLRSIKYFFGDVPDHILPYDPKWHELFAILYFSSKIMQVAGWSIYENSDRLY